MYILILILSTGVQPTKYNSTSDVPKVTFQEFNNQNRCEYVKHKLGKTIRAGDIYLLECAPK